MKLLIDAGNSSIKWAVLNAGHMDPMKSLLHSGFQAHTQLFDDAWGKLPVPEKVLVSNVAGPVFSSPFESWVRDRWECPVEYARTCMEAFGVINGYTEPEQLGIDRWLGLIGARSLTHDAVMIVDAGTAITIDIMNAQGKHLGGLIAPGLNMMRQVLTGRTAGIVVDRAVTEAGFPAHNTTEAVLAGTHKAASALVRETIKEVNGIFEKPVQVFITGGDADILMQDADTYYKLEQALVLKGLMTMAETKQ